MICFLYLDFSVCLGSFEILCYGLYMCWFFVCFVQCWFEYVFDMQVVYCDIGVELLVFVDGCWVYVVFMLFVQCELWMYDCFVESDVFIDMLLVVDVIVVGVLMYNFGMFVQFKVYIDNIVCVGCMFGFDCSCFGELYWLLLVGMNKCLVIVSLCGDFGYGFGQCIVYLNYVEVGVVMVFGYIGIIDVVFVVVEYDEFVDEWLCVFIVLVESEVDVLVVCMVVVVEVVQLISWLFGLKNGCGLLNCFMQVRWFIKFCFGIYVCILYVGGFMIKFGVVFGLRFSVIWCVGDGYVDVIVFVKCMLME